MDYLKILSDLGKILFDLGVFTIAAFYIKKIIENSANKRLEEFKGALSIIENKQNSLHLKRLEVIEQLYALLIDLNSSMRNLTNPVKHSEIDFDANEMNLNIKARSDLRDFGIFFQKKRIYFNDKTCEIVDEILKEFSKAYSDYNEHKIYEDLGIPDRASRLKVIDSYNSVKDEIPKVKARLEKDFRNLLDVK